MHEAIPFLVVGVLMALSPLLALAAQRLNVPFLVVFLALGMVLGPDVLGLSTFHDVEVARVVGVIGLVAILYEGGLSTSWRRLRMVAIPAIMLSTIGVIVTAVLTGVIAYWLFDLPILAALLMGAVMSSTDAAAVFATFRYTNIRRRLARTLEAETGGNDPMAIALTIGFISWIQQPTYDVGDITLLLVRQLGIGLVVGVAIGYVAARLIARLPATIASFAAVSSIATCALAFGAATAVGGSGFLAVYIVGLAVGSTPSRYRAQLTVFHEGLAFVAQVAMFIILGLYVLPHQLANVAFASLGLALALIFLVRPIAVVIATFGSKFSVPETLFLGLAGLKGAVPIVLGTLVLSAGVEHGSIIFNAVFFVVVLSAIIQGGFLTKIAGFLGVTEPFASGSVMAPIGERIEQIRFVVEPYHAIAGVMVHELGLPANTQLKSVIRGKKRVAPNKSLTIETGDALVIMCPSHLQPELEDVMVRWRRRI